jgi:UDP-N-acetylmuramyl pentapeptide phosphotransferase/UDP-N-acetylglucosamine-1-phosphate transferase
VNLGLNPAALFVLQVTAATIGFGFLLSVLLVRLSVLLAHHHQILARPSERGSHTIATPRLGGIGVAIAFLIGATLIERITSVVQIPAPWFYALAVASTWALVGGLLDDILDLPAANKFLFQAIAAITLVLLGGGLNRIALPGGQFLILDPIPGAILTIAIVIFWINAYNFMDGMDGQAAAFAAMVGLGLAAPILLVQFLSPVALLSALLIGTAYGLFTQNHSATPQHRKTFMGDSGSHFIGTLIITLIIAASQIPTRADRPAGVPLIAGLILLFPFIYDVTFTLLRRLAQGQNILQAHRTHLYQRLLVSGWTHGAALILAQLTWLSCFISAQIYTQTANSPIPNTTTQIQCIAAAITTMIVYHMIVNLAEQHATIRNHTP